MPGSVLATSPASSTSDVDAALDSQARAAGWLTAGKQYVSGEGLLEAT